MAQLSTIRTDEPRSIRAVARAVDRNVSNVHRELTELARLGVIDLGDNAGAKRPVFPYRRLLIGPFIGSALDCPTDDAIESGRSGPPSRIPNRHPDRRRTGLLPTLTAPYS